MVPVAAAVTPSTNVFTARFLRSGGSTAPARSRRGSRGRNTPNAARVAPSGPATRYPDEGGRPSAPRRLVGREHAEDVAAEDLREVRLPISTGAERRGQRRQLRHVLEARRRARDAVEVAAETDVVDPGHAGDVLDVVDEPRQRHRGQPRSFSADGPPELGPWQAECAH